MMKKFDFDVPKYQDFNCHGDDEELDRFFDTDHEVEQLQIKKEKITPEPNVQVPLKLENNIKTEENSSLFQNSTPRVTRKARRSINGNIPTATVPPYSSLEDVLNEAMEQLLVKKEHKRRTLFEGITLSVPSQKNHTMTTRQDQISKTPKLDLRSRSVIRRQDEVAGCKRRGSPVNSTQSKYICMAEKIMHFERDTPPRFHSKRLSGNFQRRQNFIPHRTLAKTPNLTALHRNRPVNEPSQEVKEEMELEEIRKNQVKAHPLNKDILKEPSIPVKLPPKPPTKPQPFKLTEVIKKPVVEGTPFHFSAKPVPKAVLATPTIRPLRERVVRVPVVEQNGTSCVIKKNDVVYQGIKTQANCKRTTVPQPFSFEERDKELLLKKETKIKEYFEEEKRAREFHANPLPTFVSATSKRDISTILPTVPDAPKFKTEERIQLRIRKSSALEEQVKPFKAQPAVILKKKPFQPTKSQQPVTCLPEMELHTERRAIEREAFDLEVKEREQLLEGLKREREMLLKRQEEEEIAQIRKEATHKANPVPSFKTPKLKKSDKPLTDAKSPYFTKRNKV